MSYTALYRKFRPDHFEDVKGQDHIVTTLKNQIKAERVGHAYLFCGTRGTGKTTIAKLFAKTVNCENQTDGSPCGQCHSCKAIAAGASMNVIEIDAASNNGVDNIREIVDEVSYSPAEGKYKVYIIDEVHMLSIGAFNALLKTLEEPPSYVIFILATTEAHKIPITILSRCQRYDFKRITIDIIADRLKELMEIEGIMAQDKAVRYIAKAADGSMRDALSLLDQCAAFNFGQELTYDKVLGVLGAVDTSVFSRMLRSILEHNVLACVELLEEIVVNGRELTQFVTDFTWYLRNLLMVKTSESAQDVVETSKENLERLEEEAALIEIDSIMRFIRIFSELSGQIRYATQKRILIEIALIKLCKPSMEMDYESLLGRVRELEEKMEKGILISGDPNMVPEGVVQAKPVTPKIRQELPKAIPEDVKAVVNGWEAFINRMAMPMKSYLKKSKLSLGNDNHLLVVMEDGLGSDFYMKNPENKKNLEYEISDMIGKEVELRFQIADSGRDFEDSYVDLCKLINMDIEVVDE